MKSDSGKVIIPCVYFSTAGLCKGTADISKNEHYLPRALGNFQDDERLADKICNDCQRVCAQLEDIFAHNSPEAFFREMVCRVGRKNHKGKNIFYEPTFGIPPLSLLGKHPGHDFEILWELVADADNPKERKCRPLRQLVFIGDDGSSLRLPFRPGRWTADKIRKLLEEKKVKNDHIVVVGNSDEEHDELKALTDALSPAGKERDVPALLDGANIEGEMLAPISSGYVRAVAKVGFHFLLKYFPAFSGHEPEFDEVKRFIHAGKADREIVQNVDEPFLGVLKQVGSTLNNWCHLLTAESGPNGIEARIQFFVGPEVRPLVWRVLISTKASKHEQATGYAYVYFDDVCEEYHGNRVPLLAI